MSIKNITITGDKLLATKAGAVAVSEVITQDVGDTDFESVRETRSIMLLENICDVSSTADKAVLNENVSEGDRIFIEHNGIIYDTTATGILPADQGLIPVMTSNTSSVGTLLVSIPSGVSSEVNAWKLFDNNNNIHANLSVRVEHHDAQYIGYTFANNEQQEVTSYSFKMGSASHQKIFGWFIQGSLDGINWVTLDTVPYNSDKFNLSNGVLSIHTISSPGMFSSYRIMTHRGTTPHWSQVFTLQLYTTGGNSIDTSSITQGAIPTRVFKYTDSIKYNDTKCIEKDVYTEFGTQGSKLFVQSIYNDAILNNREIKTTINFSATGNELLEISGQVYKAV